MLICFKEQTILINTEKKKTQSETNNTFSPTNKDKRKSLSENCLERLGKC